ncbi:MAG TPA: FadR family transcriptional regulator [Firmicutes bacterium]|nr:FadR family transcriptional regulator [Bacillota bacterium]
MQPIKRESVADLVYEQILEQIVKGEWAPGTKIPSENELSRMLGVSRISIREAFQRLVSLGILETRQGDGTYVKEFSPGMYMNSLIPLLVLDPVDLKEVMEYRRIIEIETSGLAAERATQEDIDELQEIYARMQAATNDVAAFAAEDLNFHLAMAKASKNSLIIKVNQVVKNILSVSMSDIVSSLGTEAGLYYHKRLIDAVIQRDRELAKELMAEHIEGTILSLQERYRS